MIYNVKNIDIYIFLSCVGSISITAWWSKKLAQLKNCCRYRNLLEVVGIYLIFILNTFWWEKFLRAPVIIWSSEAPVRYSMAKSSAMLELITFLEPPWNESLTSSSAQGVSCLTCPMTIQLALNYLPTDSLHPRVLETCMPGAASSCSKLLVSTHIKLLNRLIWVVSF